MLDGILNTLTHSINVPIGAIFLCNSIRRKNNRKCRYEESKNRTFGLGWLPFFFSTSGTARLYFSVLFWPSPTLLASPQVQGLDGCCFDTPRRLVCFGCYFLFVYSTRRASHLVLPLLFRFLNHSEKKTHFALVPRTHLNLLRCSTLIFHFFAYTPNFSLNFS